MTYRLTDAAVGIKSMRNTGTSSSTKDQIKHTISGHSKIDVPTQELNLNSAICSLHSKSCNVRKEAPMMVYSGHCLGIPTGAQGDGQGLGGSGVF